MYRIGKVLNHNAVLAVNGEDGKQYLLMGKGIGFGKKVSERVEPGEDSRIYTLQSCEERGSADEIVKTIDPEFLEISNLVLKQKRYLGILTAISCFLWQTISIMRWSGSKSMSRSAIR